MNPFTKAIYGFPLLGGMVRGARLSWTRWLSPFHDSASYWERRYVGGGSSGEGSYGRLAEFKAEVINQIVAEEGISSVIEWGSGDGNQLSLANYESYIGLDVSQAAIAQCRRRFAGDRTKSFTHLEPNVLNQLAGSLHAELALSLDVIYHLVEDNLFESYMQSLFNSARRFVLIYSSNQELAAELPHVRHRRFDTWIAAHRPDWTLVRHVRNRYPQRYAHEPETSRADFYLYRISQQPKQHA